jgi:RNase H-fold protein (predicted Holliday junction resolvase)
MSVDDITDRIIFNDRPSKEIIEQAEQNGKLIVVRIPVSPESSPEERVTRANAILEELDTQSPVVLCMCDEGKNVDLFREIVIDDFRDFLALKANNDEE